MVKACWQIYPMWFILFFQSTSLKRVRMTQRACSPWSRYVSLGVTLRVLSYWGREEGGGELQVYVAIIKTARCEKDAMLPPHRVDVTSHLTTFVHVLHEIAASISHSPRVADEARSATSCVVV